MSSWAVRGATKAAQQQPRAIVEATEELMRELIEPQRPRRRSEW